MPEIFGQMPSGETVYRVVLDAGPLKISVITYGAVLQSIEAPDGQGQMANVALGFATLNEYLINGGNFGAVPGRYAGRIAYGRFTIDGVPFQVSVNRPPHSLHGGVQGFGKRNWSLVSHGPRHAELELNSVDGDEGFPGNVLVRVRYSVDRTALRIDYSAETDRPTTLNLTNHSYFNLAGEGSGNILRQKLSLDADHFLPIREDGIPTGDVSEVGGTPFDFRQIRAIGDHMNDDYLQLRYGQGYDHAYLVGGTGLRRAAYLLDPGSRRTMTVLTTEPVIHLYTGNNIPGTFSGISGRTYTPYSGVCFEAEHPQDSPNHPNFASTIVRPGTPFTATTLFRFGVADA